MTSDDRRSTTGRALAWRRLRAAWRADEGYAIALTALMIIPIMSFTALAVDLGSWQARAARIQSAAEAAALHGARYMPNLTVARTEANRVLQRSGFVHGVDGITTSVSAVGATKVRVTVRDTTVDQYFSGLVRDNVYIERSATAELLRPIPMGSPRNYLGTNQWLSGTWRENIMLSIANYCRPKEQGDRIMSFSDWNYSATTLGGGSFQGCVPGSQGATPIANTEYDSRGYVYAVEVPEANPGGTLVIQSLGLATCNGQNSEGNAPNQITRVTVRDDGGSDVFSGPVLAGPLDISSNGTPAHCGVITTGTAWQTLASVAASPGDIFYVQIQSPPQTTECCNNQFALRAYIGAWAQCTGDPAAVGYNPACPNVYAVDNMGTFLNATGTEADFYFASISDAYAGRTMEIYLWDPGEGAAWLELLDPNGVRVSAETEIACQNGEYQSDGTTCTGENAPPTVAPLGGADGSGMVTQTGYGPWTAQRLNLGNNQDFCANRPSNRVTSCRLYNDRMVKISYTLPTDMSIYNGRTWWKIRVRSAGASVTDRATWSLQIKGDPVRLVPTM